jgi:hypothetical protein
MHACGRMHHFATPATRAASLHAPERNTLQRGIRWVGHACPRMQHVAAQDPRRGDARPQNATICNAGSGRGTSGRPTIQCFAKQRPRPPCMLAPGMQRFASPEWRPASSAGPECNTDMWLCSARSRRWIGSCPTMQQFAAREGGAASPANHGMQRFATPNTRAALPPVPDHSLKSRVELPSNTKVAMPPALAPAIGEPASQ